MDTPSTLGHFETAPSTLNFLIETPLGFNYFELSDYQIIWVSSNSLMISLNLTILIIF